MKHITLKQKNHFWLGLIASVLMVFGSSQVFANPTESIPKTVPAIWEAIDKHSASINQILGGMI